MVYDFYYIRIDASIPSSSLELTIPEVLEGEDPKAGWGWIGARTDLLRCGENQRNVDILDWNFFPVMRLSISLEGYTLTLILKVSNHLEYHFNTVLFAMMEAGIH